MNKLVCNGESLKLIIGWLSWIKKLVIVIYVGREVTQDTHNPEIVSYPLHEFAEFFIVINSDPNGLVLVLVFFLEVKYIR